MVAADVVANEVVAILLSCKFSERILQQPRPRVILTGVCIGGRLESRPRPCP